MASRFKPVARNLTNKSVDKGRAGKTLTLSEQAWLGVMRSSTATRWRRIARGLATWGTLRRPPSKGSGFERVSLQIQKLP